MVADIFFLKLNLSWIFLFHKGNAFPKIRLWGKEWAPSAARLALGSKSRDALFSFLQKGWQSKAPLLPVSRDTLRNRQFLKAQNCWVIAKTNETELLGFYLRILNTKLKIIFLPRLKFIQQGKYLDFLSKWSPPQELCTFKIKALINYK